MAPFPQRVLELAELLGAQLRQHGWTCATAESCTGGGIGYAITSIAGSSDYFMGGIISYSNSAKEHLLGVRRETLERVGAVSPDCAGEMAAGVRSAVGVDLGIASTGIAGPGGATARKPVGLVYIAVSWPNGTEVRELSLAGSRAEIMQLSIREALALASRILGSAQPN